MCDETCAIRPYREDDLAAIEVMAQQVVCDGTVFPFEDVGGVLEYWFSTSAAVFIAEKGSQIAGSYVVKPNQPDRCAHVANAGYMVDEQSRGQGIGLAMGEHSMGIARQLGYLAIQFNLVVSTNHSAIRLWKRLGFDVIGTVPQGFRHDQQGLVDVLIMHRHL